MATIGYGELHFYPYERQVIRWFTDSPDSGDPACICSLCGKLIGEDECAVRVTKTENGVELEARFHDAPCFPLVDKRHFEE